MSAPRHPFRKDIAGETRAAMGDLVGIGIGAVVAGFYATAITKMPVVGAAALLGVLALSAPRTYRRLHGAAARTINESFNYIGLGKLNEASLLLDEAEARPRFLWVRRLVDVQRAIIAMRRGDMAEARDKLDSAIALPLGLVERANSRYQIEGARALRAFARATLGDREGALEDIQYVRTQERASLDALAKVALSEALLLERAGERARLKELLDREETLLLEHTHPRERAIVRGLQRMLRASAKASIYRQTAPADDVDKTNDEPPLADWVAKIAPDVAPFVRVPRRSTDGSPAMIAEGAAVAPRPAAVAAVVAAHAARATPKRTSAVLRWAAAVAVVVVLVGALISAFGSARLPEPSVDALFPDTSSINPLVALVPLVALTIGGIAALGVAQVRRARTRLAQRRLAQRAPRLDQRTDASTTERLVATATGPSNIAAAQARLVLAGNAERRGDFSAVITECRLGIGRLADMRTRAQADILYPDLIALSAFALAASGRSDEADAELAMLHPAYPHHARAVFRVRLVQCLRRGDLKQAARWVDQGAADLPLSIREELLADIVRALHAPASAGAGEIERIKDELRRSEERRKWLELAVPGIVAKFERSVDEGEDEVQAPPPPPLAEAPRVRVAAPEVGGAGAPQEARPNAAEARHNAADVEARAMAEAQAEEAELPAGWARRQRI